MADPVTWVDDADVARALGTTALDAEWLAVCTTAANAWAWRKRQQAGYADDVATEAPGADVATGTALYGAQLYQARGGGDGAASFDTADVPADPPFGSMGRIRQLLGIGKAQVY